MLYKDNKRYVQLCKSFRQTETAYIREKSGEVMLYGNVGCKYILTVPRNKECKRFIVILNGGYFETNVNGDVFAPNSEKKDHEEFMGNVGAFEELANKLASCGYEYEKLGTYPKFNDRIAEDIIGWESTY